MNYLEEFHRLSGKTVEEAVELSSKFLNEAKKEKFKLYGKTYNSFVFGSDKEANDFLKKNKEYGVIGTKGNKVYVAKNLDKGE